MEILRHTQNLFKTKLVVGGVPDCNLNGTKISIENLHSKADNWINAIVFMYVFVCRFFTFIVDK